mgnify:CR=1 FL=1
MLEIAENSICPKCRVDPLKEADPTSVVSLVGCNAERSVRPAWKVLSGTTVAICSEMLSERMAILLTVVSPVILAMSAVEFRKAGSGLGRYPLVKLLVAELSLDPVLKTTDFSLFEFDCLRIAPAEFEKLPGLM